MSEWVPIEESISLEGLLERWKGVEIDGEQLDFQAIDNFVRGCKITAYDRKDWIIRHGHKEWRGQRRPPMLGLNGSDPFAPGHDIIFDQKEIDSIERQMFPSEKNPEYIPVTDLQKKATLAPPSSRVLPILKLNLSRRESRLKVSASGTRGCMNETKS